MKIGTVIAIFALVAIMLPVSAYGTYVDDHSHLLQSGDNGFIVELTFAQPTFDLKTYRGNLPLHQVRIDGLSYLPAPGKAMVPEKGLLFGIPPDSQPTFEILEINEAIWPDKYNLYPSPSYPAAEGKNSPCKNVCGPLHEEYILDEQFYQSDFIFPEQPVLLGFTGYIRNQRVAQLRIRPIRYNPARSQVRHITRILIRVDYHYQGPAEDGLSGHVDDQAAALQEQMLRASLINYPETTRWPRPESKQLLTAKFDPDQNQKTKGPEDFRLRVDQAGIYRVTYDELVLAGITPALVDPQTFRLLAGGQEVEIHVFGELDGTFDPGDYIEFWGEPLKERYSYANYYLLTYDGDPGWRMGELNAPPSGFAPVAAAFQTKIRFEENNHWFPGMPTWESTEIWEWRWITAPKTELFPFTLEYLSDLPLLANLTVRLQGRSASETTPDHHTKIFFNGTEIDDLYWDGDIEFTHKLSFPMSDLIDGQNVLSVTAPGDTGAFEDVIYLNWFELEIWKNYTATNDVLVFSGETTGNREFRVDGFNANNLIGFDVSDPAAPLLITDAVLGGGPGNYDYTFETYATPNSKMIVVSEGMLLSPTSIEPDIPSDLTDPANEADYLILTDRLFAVPAQDLADFRATEGLRTMVVFVQDIYDEFNFGVPDPQAIVDFLDMAYGAWTGPSFSYLMLLGDSHIDYNDYLNFDKKIHVPSMLIGSPLMGATPSDVPYSLLVGDDPLPDVHLGRIPAEDVAAAQAQVDKIIDYENQAADTWNKEATFATDNNFPDFDAHSETLIGYLPLDVNASRMYLGFNNPAVIHDGILGLINQGQLIVNYLGHGFVDNWAGERIFTSADSEHFTNGSKMNFVMAFSCLNGYFPIVEGFRSISEAFLMEEANGSIGSLAPVGYTIRTDNEIFSEEIYQNLFVSGLIEVGPAITTAKINAIGAGGVGREIVDLYHLLGDPALDLKIVLTDGDDDSGDDYDDAFEDLDSKKDSSSKKDDEPCGWF